MNQIRLVIKDEQICWPRIAKNDKNYSTSNVMRISASKSVPIQMPLFRPRKLSLVVFEAICVKHTKSLTEQWLSHKFAFDKNVFKTFPEFRICWKCSKLEHSWMWIRTSSHPYYRPDNGCGRCSVPQQDPT